MQPDHLPSYSVHNQKGDKNNRQDRKRQTSVESVFYDLKMFFEPLTLQTITAKDTRNTWESFAAEQQQGKEDAKHLWLFLPLQAPIVFLF